MRVDPSENHGTPLDSSPDRPARLPEEAPKWWTLPVFTQDRGEDPTETYDEE
jgi:hypothetical protein